MSANSLQLFAPVSGRILPLNSVPDPVFAQKLVGDGVAIDPTSETLLAPCDAEVLQIHPARHAITLKASESTQIILHIGLDTVHLKGVGFTAKVKAGDKVRAGQALIQFDADRIAASAKSLITLMIVTGEVKLQHISRALAQAGKDVVLEVSPSQPTAVTGSTAGAANTKIESRPVKVQLPSGLHARPAALLINLAKSFQAELEIVAAKGSASLKSVVGVLGLEIASGDLVKFRAVGPDAEKAALALADFLAGLIEKPEAAVTAPVTMAKASTIDGQLAGIAISPGLVIGRVQQFTSQELDIEEFSKTTPATERAHLQRALQQSSQELRELMAKMTLKSDAQIFSMHQDLLDDPDLLQATEEMIQRGRTAAFAWSLAITAQANRLSGLKNEILAARAVDVRDIGRRVLNALAHDGVHDVRPRPSSHLKGTDLILIAETLTPSDIAQIDIETVRAICTTTGGATSHVAILARSMGLPAISGMDARVLDLKDGSEVLFDGDLGVIRTSPTAADKARVVLAQQEQEQKRKLAESLAQYAAVTRDGKRIEVAANIGSVQDAIRAVELGADGVGLLRSEFLFLERDTAPSEEEQYQIYQQIADTLGSRRLVIRTLDVGGDKPLKYLPIAPEENPFLGIRGIRVGLLHQQILRDQLRAILRVKSAKPLHVMFPMIATVEEFRQAKAILEDERAKLQAPAVYVGIMVEVPSAALLAPVLAKEVDFFSIGTNDLTQYTLAMDRGHKDLAKAADALHPSVLCLIALTCGAAHAHGKWVGVCGGLGGDPKAVAILVGLGVEELSVSLPAISLVKARVRELQMPFARDLSQAALHAESADQVRNLDQDLDFKPLAREAHDAVL